MSQDRPRPRTGLLVGLAALLVLSLALQAREIAHLTERLDALQAALDEHAQADAGALHQSTPRGATPPGPRVAPGGPMMPSTPFGPDDPVAGDPFAGHPDPFEMFDRMRQRMGLPDPLTPPLARPAPPVGDGLVDHGDRYVVTVAVPDPDQARTEVALDGETLRITVTGPSGVTQRSTTLPGPVDPADVTSEMRGGRLIVTLPKQR